MAEMVSDIKVNPQVGHQVLEIITSGMYDEPLMIIREYVQNSVDSIDNAVRDGIILLDEASINIDVDGAHRSITIEDNGIGIANSEAKSTLMNIGCSSKKHGVSRGFRGIGRLGGLAYCQKIIFETKTIFDDAVLVLEWDYSNSSLCNSVPGDDVREMISKSITSYLRPTGNGDGDHFFKVTMLGVNKFHSDVLMNVKEMRKYLAQVSPVPYAGEFTYAPIILEHYSKFEDIRSYKILVNDVQVLRPYSVSYMISSAVTDRINDIELFDYKDKNGDIVAIGWYGYSGFIGAIPQEQNISGIRVRQGNIQVGSDLILSKLYSERRFSGWVVGEINVKKGFMKPNARRDDFEHDRDYEFFLEKSTLLCKKLSTLCRKASSGRATSIRIKNNLHYLDGALADTAIYLDEVHYKKVAERCMQIISSTINIPTLKSEELDKLEHYKQLIEDRNYYPLYMEVLLDGRRMRGFDYKSMLRHVSLSIYESYENSESPDDIIRCIIDDFIKETYAERIREKQ